jgi:hypothetical protein
MRNAGARHGTGDQNSVLRDAVRWLRKCDFWATGRRNRRYVGAEMGTFGLHPKLVSLATFSVSGLAKMIERAGVEAKIPFPVHAHMLRELHPSKERYGVCFNDHVIVFDHNEPGSWAFRQTADSHGGTGP